MVSQINGNAISTVAGMNSGAQRATNNKAAETAKPQESRVEELKRQIESGEYKVDLKKTAEKVAEALL
ncbi:MAG: flagellar biosynthesis anti-sigma factor FlgM [Campylobacterales bacterium]